MMELSQSTYYYRPKILRKDREQADAELRDRIEVLQAEFSCWGYRTLKAQLQRVYGQQVNSKRLLRVMRRYGLFRGIKQRFIRTTDSEHGFAVYPNRLKGLEVTAINQVWVADITYIRIVTGFVFLAVLLDVFSRRVIGWSIGKRIDHHLTLEALRMAFRVRNPGAGLIHHSDRGVQYACGQYVKELQKHETMISMSAKGSPYDNAYAESFFKTLKKEEVYLWEYESFIDVAERIPEFIEQVYNKKRVHSGIQYLPPEEFEAIVQDHQSKQSLGQITLKLHG
jgi:transposase InsO family protein